MKHETFKGIDIYHHQANRFRAEHYSATIKTPLVIVCQHKRLAATFNGSLAQVREWIGRSV